MQRLTAAITSMVAKAKRETTTGDPGPIRPEPIIANPRASMRLSPCPTPLL